MNKKVNQMKEDFLKEFKARIGKQVKLADWKTEGGS